MKSAWCGSLCLYWQHLVSSSITALIPLLMYFRPQLASSLNVFSHTAYGSYPEGLLGFRPPLLWYDLNPNNMAAADR